MSDLYTEVNLSRSTYFTGSELKQFVRGYVDAGCWADLNREDRPDERGSEAYEFGVDDLDPDSAKKVVEECIGFMDSNHDDLRSYAAAVRTEAGFSIDYQEHTIWDCAGHDFYLTAAGHGAGFWDRGLGELGERLTKESKPYTINDIWLDPATGKIHFEI